MKFLCGQCGRLRFALGLLKVNKSVDTPFPILSGQLDRHTVKMGCDKSYLEINSKILWDYLRIDSPLQKSDAIIVLGNSDLRTADHAAQLHRDGLAPLVVVSGYHGHGTHMKWDRSEAAVFSERLMQNNVPAESILQEPKATNTGENVRFTQELLENPPHLLKLRSAILVQTPFMGRRCLATFLRQWEHAEEVKVAVTSPPIPLEEYPCQEAGYGSLEEVVAEMVGAMERILSYPELGYQVPQSVPARVMEAFGYLRSVVNVSEF